MPDINYLPPSVPPAGRNMPLDLTNENGAHIPSSANMTSNSSFGRFIPPINFASVEDYIYRSGEPEALNLPFVETLNLKTVIWLAAEEPKEAFTNFVEGNPITIHHLGLVDGAQPWDPMTEDAVRGALELIVDSVKHPILICCGMGRHRTGTVVGCLRRLQGWNLASALEEYRRFTGPRRARIINELHIEAFQRECVPLGTEKELLPRWLWWTHDQLEAQAQLQAQLQAAADQNVSVDAPPGSIDQAPTTFDGASNTNRSERNSENLVNTHSTVEEGRNDNGRS